MKASKVTEDINVGLVGDNGYEADMAASEFENLVATAHGTIETRAGIYRLGRRYLQNPDFAPNLTRIGNEEFLLSDLNPEAHNITTDREHTDLSDTRASYGALHKGDTALVMAQTELSTGTEPYGGNTRPGFAVRNSIGGSFPINLGSTVNARIRPAGTALSSAVHWHGNHSGYPQWNITSEGDLTGNWSLNNLGTICDPPVAPAPWSYVIPCSSWEHMRMSFFVRLGGYYVATGSSLGNIWYAVTYHDNDPAPHHGQNLTRALERILANPNLENTVPSVGLAGIHKILSTLPVEIPAAVTGRLTSTEFYSSYTGAYYAQIDSVKPCRTMYEANSDPVPIWLSASKNADTDFPMTHVVTRDTVPTLPEYAFKGEAFTQGGTDYACVSGYEDLYLRTATYEAGITSGTRTTITGAGTIKATQSAPYTVYASGQRFTGPVVGDNETNPVPLFVGDPMIAMGMFAGRGFIITKRGVFFSDALDPYNFWRTNLTTVLDTDPFYILTPVHTEYTGSKAYIVVGNSLIVNGTNLQRITYTGGSFRASSASLRKITSAPRSPLVSIKDRVFYLEALENTLALVSFNANRTDGQLKTIMHGKKLTFDTHSFAELVARDANTLEILVLGRRYTFTFNVLSDGTFFESYARVTSPVTAGLNLLPKGYVVNAAWIGRFLEARRTATDDFGLMTQSMCLDLFMYIQGTGTLRTLYEEDRGDYTNYVDTGAQLVAYNTTTGEVRTDLDTTHTWVLHEWVAGIIYNTHGVFDIPVARNRYKDVQHSSVFTVNKILLVMRELREMDITIDEVNYSPYVALGVTPDNYMVSGLAVAGDTAYRNKMVEIDALCLASRTTMTLASHGAASWGLERVEVKGMLDTKESYAQ